MCVRDIGHDCGASQVLCYLLPGWDRIGIGQTQANTQHSTAQQTHLNNVDELLLIFHGPITVRARPQMMVSDASE